MNGDLSLSQSLGGLRIANPDDEALASPTSPTDRPTPSSHSSSSTVTDTRRMPLLSHDPSLQEAGGLDFDPSTYTVQQSSYVPPSPPSPRRSSAEQHPQFQRSRLSHRQSMPLNHQAQMSAQYPSHSSVSQPIRSPGMQSTSSRPVSGMYNIPNANSSGSSQGSYRYRQDDYVNAAPSSRGNGIGRSGSNRLAANGAAAAMGMVPNRQPSQHMNGTGNSPLPPRRNSRRTKAPIASSSPLQASYLGSTPVSDPTPLARSAEEWQDRGAATSTRTETDADGRPVTRVVKKGVKDFNFGRTLGEGSYSTVLAATDRQNLKEYAIKVLDKRHIIKEKKVKYVNIEKDTLNRLTEHPGIVRLYYTFQDERSLYFVLDLASGGELLGVLKKLGSFDEECTRFYGAQILDSIAYMHNRGIIHRDLKPENVLLDRDMHVKITDFGTAKILPATPLEGGPGDSMDGSETDRAVSFVGTAEYVSPELLNDKNACKASDLWAFGCIIYQLLAGRPPFKAANEYLTFQKIIALDYSFPEGFPEVARDLVERLLVSDPSLRLPIEHVRNHQFFAGVRWGTGLWKQKAPRLKAYVPPAAEPIKLNGQNGGGYSPGGMPVQPMHSPQTQHAASNMRPAMRNITELPPPSQLDIDWSPVLTRSNERILKLGNLNVLSAAPQALPNGDGTPQAEKKFRFFGGNTTKKRERLVLITSSARVILAAAGGGEKKAKMEIFLLSSGTSWKSFVDAKGLTAWAVDTRDKHITFEDPRATTSDPDGSKYSTQEWLEAIERAREFAISQSMTNSYSGDSTFNDLSSTMSSPDSSTLDMDPQPRREMRHTLRKDQDGESIKGRKNRFSKRHSKSGLAAVF